MSQNLSRKYRPQTFGEVVNQNHIKITLQNEVLSGQIAHAYLFTGPRGIGKTSLARILAKALNCQNRQEKEFEPCNKCPACESTTAGRNLDLIEIDAATHTQVDKVRENIIENVRFSPHNGKYKIFIIDEVHMLSTAAFNALLKTLEEPPEYAVFILCTTEIYKLPETIISRCQRFDFKKVSAELIKEKLSKIVAKEKLNIADQVLATIAFRSGGFVRDAESLLGQIVTIIADGKKAIDLKDIEPLLPRSDLDSIAKLVDTLINHNTHDGIENINTLIVDGIDVDRFNLDLIDYLRKILLVKNGLKNKDYNLMGLPEKIEHQILQQAERVDEKYLIAMLNKFIAIQHTLKDAEIPQLPLELAVAELCSVQNKANQNENLDHHHPSNPPKNISIKTEDKETKTKSNDIKPGLINDIQHSNDTLLNIEQIKKVWPEFIKKVQQVNHSLPLILEDACPVRVKNNFLELGFSFELHAKKMKDRSCLEAAEKILEELISKQILIKPIVLSKKEIDKLKNEYGLNKKTAATMNSQPANDVEDLLKTFGGEVVE